MGKPNGESAMTPEERKHHAELYEARVGDPDGHDKPAKKAAKKAAKKSTSSQGE